METNFSSIQNELKLQANSLAEQIVEMQYSANPTYWNRFGAKGKLLSIRDANYHIDYLSEAVGSNSPEIFTSYVAWVKQLFTGLRLEDDVMLKTLEVTRDVIQQKMPKEIVDIISPFIDAGIVELHKPILASSSYISLSDPLGYLATSYTQALLSGDRRTASKLIMDAIEKDTPIKSIYLNVFQQSQYEIGRLWLENKISVAKEHFCSAATQQIMSQIYPLIFAQQRIGQSFVAANVGGELHEIGIRMVADFFEMDGWDTYYLGANAPASSIIAAIKENNATMVGLSIAIPHHRTALKETIIQIKEATQGRVKVLIGGVATNSSPKTLYEFQADGYAPDAQGAVDMAKKLMEV
jgi:Predicted cobalamin binding protein